MQRHRGRKEVLHKTIENFKFDIPSSDPGYLGAVETHFKERIDNLKYLSGLLKDNPTLEIEIFILSSCFIDAFAGFFYSPAEIGTRFRKVLYDFGHFSGVDFEKVSLVKLEKLLWTEAKYILLSNPYLRYMEQKIKKIDFAHAEKSISHDPIKSDLLTELLGVDAHHIDLVKEIIEQATYASVLYEKYRNPSIHEAVISEHWNPDNHKVVHYLSIDSSPSLIFPSQFLVELANHVYTEIMERVRRHFYAQQ